MSKKLSVNILIFDIYIYDLYNNFDPSLVGFFWIIFFQNYAFFFFATSNVFEHCRMNVI